MVRLPTPGSDENTWGDILNAYLEVSLASDGTLNSNVVNSSQIASNAVTNAKLDAPTQATIASVAGKYVKPVGGIPSTDMTSAVQTSLGKADTSVQSTQLGAASGVATLDSGSHLTVGQLPSSVVTDSQTGGATPINSTGKTNGQALLYSTAAGAWEPATLSLAGLADVSESSPAVNQGLVYNGSKWVNSTQAAGADLIIAASNSTAAAKAAASVICSGTADQTAINTAISALASSGVSIVLANGTYNLTAPIVFQKDTSSLRGMSRGGTIMSVASGFSGSWVVDCNRNDLGSPRYCYEIDVGHFQINGNYIGAQGSISGVRFGAARSTLTDVDVLKMSGSAVQIGAGISTTSAFDTVVENSMLHGCGAGGITTNYAGDSSIKNCHVFENAGGGILDSDTLSTISGCYVWGNMDSSAGVQGGGIVLGPSSVRTSIIGNKIEQNRGGLVFGPGNQASGGYYTITANSLGSNSTTINPSVVSSNGGAGGNMPAGYVTNGLTNVHSDIEFISNSGGSPQGVMLIGNIIDPALYHTSDNTSAYAIYLTSGTLIDVRHNYFATAGTSGMVFWGVGGGNVFSPGQNFGWVTDASGTATITAAATSVTVTHGLAYAPNLGDISVVLTNQPTNALGNVWVSNVGSTTFQINVANAPGAATAIFGWSVSPHRFS